MKKENLLKFYRAYRLYIFPAVVGISSLLLIVFAIYPQTVTLIKNQREQGELINKAQFLESKVSALEGYKEEELSRKLEIALAAYPDNKDFGTAMGVLQQIVAQSGFRIVTISLTSGSKAVSGGAQSYELKLDLVGIKPGLNILLNNLESSPRLMRTVSMDVSSTSQDLSNVALVVEVLFADVPKSFGAVDTPLPEITREDEALLTRLAQTGRSVLQAGSVTGPRGKVNPFE